MIGLEVFLTNREWACVQVVTNMKKYFKESLENFAFDAAGGRAIRHLHELGLSPEEIEERLDFPVPLSRIKAEIEKLEREKEAGEDGYEYVRVYGKYGRSYVKRVKKDDGNSR